MNVQKRRPAETIAGTVGTAVGLGFALLHAYVHWDLDQTVVPYVPVAVGWIAAVVTWIKVRRSSLSPRGREGSPMKDGP